MVQPPVFINELAKMTWTEVRDLPPACCVALLPVGAIEAHGPHLPLQTDILIAQGMARSAAVRLAALGQSSVLLEPLAYTTAPFARGFAGTITLRPSTLFALLTDIATQVLDQGFSKFVLCNAHLDPSHVGVLREVQQQMQSRFADRVVFPDVTRRANAQRLSAEFQSGACHAGQYESSIVLAQAPEQVRESIMRDLPDNMHSLVDAMQAGHDSFEQSGGPLAYFGSPAKANAQEGREMLDRLGEIVVDALKLAPKTP